MEALAHKRVIYTDHQEHLEKLAKRYLPESDSRPSTASSTYNVPLPKLLHGIELLKEHEIVVRFKLKGTIDKSTGAPGPGYWQMLQTYYTRPVNRNTAPHIPTNEELEAMREEIKVIKDETPENPKTASPEATQKIAELGLDIEEIEGTGGDGMVMRQDVDKHIESLQTKKADVSVTAEALMREHGIDADKIKGSGQNGKINKPDVEAYIKDMGKDVA